MSSSINKKTIRKQLSEHHKALSKFHLRDLFTQDRDRGKNFTSQFANLYIDFSKNISTSLEIAMEELHQKVIPIVIRRTLPNGDYQNIPIDQFQ